MKKIVFLSLLCLTGCVIPQSPTLNMSPRDIHGLSDERLCDFQNNYPFEQKLDIEIARRSLSCDEASLECRGRGLKPRSSEYQICKNDIENKIEAQRQAQKYETMLDEQNRKIEELNRQQKQRDYYDQQARIKAEDDAIDAYTKRRSLWH